MGMWLGDCLYLTDREKTQIVDNVLSANNFLFQVMGSLVCCKPMGAMQGRI